MQPTMSWWGKNRGENVSIARVPVFYARLFRPSENNVDRLIHVPHLCTFLLLFFSGQAAGANPAAAAAAAAAGLSVLPYPYPFAAAAAAGGALPWHAAVYQQPNLLQQQQQQQQQNGSANGSVTPTQQQNGGSGGPLKRPGSPSSNGTNTPESVAAAAAAAGAAIPNGALPPNYIIPAFFDPNNVAMMRLANPAAAQQALAAAAAAAGMPPGSAMRLMHPGSAAVSGAPLLINNGQPGGSAGSAPGFTSPLGLQQPQQQQNSLGYGGNSNSLSGLSSRRDSIDRNQPAFSPSLVDAAHQYKAAAAKNPGWPYNSLGGPLGGGLGSTSPPPATNALGLLPTGNAGGGGGSRFSSAPGDRGFQQRNGVGSGLFGSSNTLFGHGGPKQRHSSSIDKQAGTRSKLLEDFR